MSPGFGEPITPGPSQKQSQKESRTGDEEEDEDEDVPTGGRKFEKKGTYEREKRASSLRFGRFVRSSRS